MRALKDVLTNLDGATVAVPEGGASNNCDSTRPRVDLHAAAAVPPTPEESMAASRPRKRTGPGQEGDLERVVKKRVDLGPDSDEDMIVLSRPGTGAHERANNQPTSATTIEHHAVSLLRAASALPSYHYLRLACVEHCEPFPLVQYLYTLMSLQVPARHPANAAVQLLDDDDDVVVSSLPAVLTSLSHWHSSLWLCEISQLSCHCHLLSSAFGMSSSVCVPVPRWFPPMPLCPPRIGLT